MKKFLLTLLAVMMFATIGTLNVLAERPQKHQFDSYISFGDSFTRGMGANQEHILGEGDDATDMTIRIVDGAYTTKIAEYYDIIPAKEDDNYGGQKMFGSKAATKYYPTGVFGLKLMGGLHLIKGDRYVEGEEWSEGGILKGYIKILFDLFGYNEEGEKGSEGHINDIIKKSEDPLITVNLGLADVIFDASTSTMGMVDIQNALSNPEELLTFLDEFGKSAKEKYDVWAVQFEEFIKTLKKLNKNSTIVLIGFMNPLREVCISEDVMLPLGSISDPVIALMNETTRFLAKKYGCLYVDISNGESTAIEKEWNITNITTGDAFSNFLAALHPTPSTMDYIARQVETEVDRHFAGSETDYNIAVDLIRYEDVNLVVLDGKVVDDYSMIGKTLTINTDNKKARLLQVFINNYDKDGKKTGVAVRTYLLMHRDGKYDAYCLDSTNDFIARAKLILRPILQPIEDAKKAYKDWYDHTIFGEITNAIRAIKERRVTE